MGHKKGFGKPTTRPHRPCQDMDDRAYFPCCKILPNLSCKNMPDRVYTLIQYVLRFYVMESVTVAFAESGCKVTQKFDICKYFIENAHKLLSLHAFKEKIPRKTLRIIEY